MKCTCMKIKFNNMYFRYQKLPFNNLIKFKLKEILSAETWKQKIKASVRYIFHLKSLPMLSFFLIMQINTEVQIKVINNTLDQRDLSLEGLS